MTQVPLQLNQQRLQPVSKRCVLHLAVEYPSRNRPDNTPAVRHFIQANPRVDYRVIALRRTANPFKCNALAGDGEGDEKVTSMRYWGLPMGIGLFASMTLVAWRIRRLLAKENLEIDLVHAHKFSFEGIAGWWLARWRQCPLALSVRGEAEAKILRFKPHYDAFFRRQLQDAAHIYYVSAWFKPLLNSRFQLDPSKQSLLPNFVAKKQWQTSLDFKEDHLVTIIDLNVYQKKGLDKLLQAIKSLQDNYPGLKLDVIGTGTDKSHRAAEALIAQQQLQSRVTLVGGLSNADLLSQLPQYAGMVMPSVNETFGMVYVEALLSGVPILHSTNTGIDGFLDDIPARVMADPLDVEEIRHALDSLLSNQHGFRQWLIANHRHIESRFSRGKYIDAYNQTFRLLTPRPNEAADSQPAQYQPPEPRRLK
ncbi:Glycosyltransferase involved in cell wall bisynthesis [Ferrimonas sediminum]|uniref:Glycosyltransferase involved in cell wall bisynthesis n=1 Tax=Ferrimonas sediminum TaxID=718193 RepID=A0A1G8TKR6_9GAMM|nr:glycosyltransferase [Ferrimonas sediminum]SDJ42043.1 Glycosyltransferase involved in cell wall bisynthesis [Ferrimonas sediminum]